MKSTLMAGALCLSAGLVCAQTPPSGQAPPPPGTPPGGTPPTVGQKPPEQTPLPGTASDHDKDKPRGDEGQKHKMTAEVVSTNPTAKTITVKNLAMDKQPSGATGDASTTGEVTLRLDGKAGDRVGSLKAGDKVKLTCKPDAAAQTPASQHCQTVTDIDESATSQSSLERIEWRRGLRAAPPSCRPSRRAVRQLSPGR